MFFILFHNFREIVLDLTDIKLMLISLSVSILIILFNSLRASAIRVDDLIILTDLITANAVLTVFL